MPSIEEIFSTDNLNKLANNPLLTLGASFLAQGRQGSGARALGEGLSGALPAIQQNQQHQQLAEYRATMQQQQAAQMQAAQAKAQQAAQFKQNLQNPAFLKTLPPQVQQWVQAGAEPEQVMSLFAQSQNIEQKQAALEQQMQMRQMQMDLAGANQANSLGMQQQRLEMERQRLEAGQNRQPTRSQTIEQPLGGNKFQRMIWDESAGGYVPFGEAFEKQANPLAALFGGGGAAVPDDGAAPGANPAIDATVNQVAPATRPMAAAGGGAAQAMPPKATAPGQPVQIKSAADFDKLPSGALFITPDGRTKMKP
ncbi:hypothetical protein [Pseudomonas mandelii]|uniref:hypothetical protein n=1 Tax=Pseudomonas mandelii TaxID=75612 RepID=UPI003C77A125